MDGARLDEEHAAIAADCVATAGLDDSSRLTRSDSAAHTAYSLWLAPSGGGYGFADWGASVRSQVPPAGWEAVMYGDPRQQAVIAIEGGGSVSVPVGGCHGQATEALYGAPAEQFERVYQQVRPLPDEAIRSATQDPAVRDASGRWSQCLAAAGWDIETPDGLDNALAPEIAAAERGRAARDELARREAALHDADTRCRGSSGLQAAFDQAFAEHGARTAAAHSTALRAYRRMLDHAAAVIAERGRS